MPDKQKNRIDLINTQSQIVKELRDSKQYANDWSGIASKKRDEVIGWVDEGEDYALHDEHGILVATVTEVISKRLDIKRFREDHPEIDLDLYYVASGSRQVRTV